MRIQRQPADWREPAAPKGLEPTGDSDSAPSDSEDIPDARVPSPDPLDDIEATNFAQAVYLSMDEAFELAFSALSRSETEPRTYAEAMKSPDAKKWHDAASEEIATMLANGTGELVPCQAAAS